ncbi:MAG: Druantia anti-phage system protein DruA [Acidimicrobiales bacterium]
MTATAPWISLPTPPALSRAEARTLTATAKQLASARGHAGVKDNQDRRAHPALAAAMCVLADLVDQGWGIRVDAAQQVTVRPPKEANDPAREKARVRKQELLKRDEQLSEPSVRRFVAEMEQPREFRGRFVSIFSLMRDGEELRTALERVEPGDNAATSLRTVIDPYVQVVDSTERCAHTGLRLGDIWRYFRHTWSNQYTSTPGRTMLLLIRDRAAPCHPVVGIAALGSSIVQIKERDDWIGWQANQFTEALAEHPTTRMARFVDRRLDSALDDLYLDDLIEDGLYWPSLWAHPAEDAIAPLRKESIARRDDHRRFVQRREFKRGIEPTDAEAWRRRAESDLFRSKRCLALADLLRCRAALLPFLSPPTRHGLARALADPDGRRAVSDLVRRAKAESVGTEMADLTVCGAIAPYNALLGGKLVAALAVSPTVVHAYHERYGEYASVIASSMAGRPIRRRNNLVFVGTTSLYGAGSSQYNRLHFPAERLGGAGRIEFRELGHSRSFGTSHLSSATVTALVRLSEQSRSGVRVNSIFGEGVNPKLRKVRDGLDLLGWPSEALLQHGRQRIVYGVSLVSNLLPYLLGAETEPNYLFRRNVKDDVTKITDWWLQRWLSPRVRSTEVLNAVAAHRSGRPSRHGARVTVPKVNFPSGS